MSTKAEEKFLVQVRDNGEVRAIGYFYPTTRALVLVRDPAIHMQRSLGAYGIDWLVYCGLKKSHNLEKIVLYQKGKSGRIETTTEVFDKYGTRRAYPPYREQIFLQVVYWERFG